MSFSGAAALELRLPDPLLGRARFGPFPCVTDALKFLLALAVGAVVAALAGPLLWLPFVGGGFLLAVYRPDGKSVDERCGDYLRWRLRPRHGAPAAGVGFPRTVQRCDGGFAAGLRVGGAPLAFLPVAEQESRFRAYRSMLDGLTGAVWMEVDSTAIPAPPFLPRDGGSGKVASAERAARDAYREFARLLVRRRRRRAVRILLVEPGDGAGSLGRLSSRIDSLRAALERLELPVERLHGAELARLAPAGGGSRG
ncbi:MAG: hypothetical protein L3K07_01385 [Thermoplasmata archaeon]|nr:hypothetical protein [Thermoplasmata archaeon]